MGRKRVREYKAEAAYSPEGLVICPVCWSRPNIDRRAERSANARRGRWNTTLLDRLVKLNGQSYPVAEMHYPCSNPLCLVITVIQWAFGLFGKEGTGPWRAKQTLKGAEAKKYQSGVTGQDGIWRGDAPPVVEPVVPEPKPRRAAPRKATKEAKPPKKGGKRPTKRTKKAAKPR